MQILQELERNLQTQFQLQKSWKVLKIVNENHINNSELNSALEN